MFLDRQPTIRACVKWVDGLRLSLGLHILFQGNA